MMKSQKFNKYFEIKEDMVLQKEYVLDLIEYLEEIKMGNQQFANFPFFLHSIKTYFHKALLYSYTLQKPDIRKE